LKKKIIITSVTGISLLILGLASVNSSDTIQNNININENKLNSIDVLPTITVDTEKNIDEVKLKSGFIHGLPDTISQNETSNLVSQLEPKSWRMSTVPIYNFVTDNIKSKYNTQITFVISDLFFSIYGVSNAQYALDLESECNPDNNPCITSFEQFKTIWKNFMEEFMIKTVQNNIHIDYYDIFNEPDGIFNGITESQKFEIFKIAHDIIRKHVPNAKIVAPSTNQFDVRELTAFMKYLEENDLTLTALSWHEFDDPDAMIEHTSKMRSIIDSIFEKKQNLKIQEIHINEYGSNDNQLVPGWAVRWLYSLEKANVDVANRACWDMGSGSSVWSNCWNGLNGMLDQDNKTPERIYWVYKSYAELDKDRIFTESSESHIISLASRNDQTEKIHLLVGSYDRSQNNIVIKIQNYPYDTSMAQAEILHILNTSSHDKIISEIQMLPVNNGEILLPIDNFGNGDAYNIVLSPET